MTKIKVWYDKKNKRLTSSGKGVEAWLEIGRHKKPVPGEEITVTPQSVAFESKKSFKAKVIDFYQCSDDMVHVEDGKGNDWWVDYTQCPKEN